MVAARTAGVASARDEGVVVRTPRDIQVTCSQVEGNNKGKDYKQRTMNLSFLIPIKLVESKDHFRHEINCLQACQILSNRNARTSTSNY